MRGDGNRLPLVTSGFDFLTYAQAWHWTDPAPLLPEARRVLRPGGALALWWNDMDAPVPWIAEQDERIRALFRRHWGHLPRAAGRIGVHHPRVRWSRRIPLDVHLANHASHSAFLMLGPAGTREFLDDERARLMPLFPDGTVEEHYVVSLSVAVA